MLFWNYSKSGKRKKEKRWPNGTEWYTFVLMQNICHCYHELKYSKKGIFNKLNMVINEKFIITNTLNIQKSC